MLEILVAVVFLAVCATTIVEGIWSGSVQSAYAVRRSQAVSAAQSEIEFIRSFASAGSLSNFDTSPNPVAVNGFSGNVTLTPTITLESNSRTLYDVSVTATWSEEISSGTRNESVTLSTVVKD